MATQPPPNLPLFYKNLQPLAASLHGKLKARVTDSAPYLVDVHAVPLTIDEFTVAQRHFPIIFATGETPVPLALMGLNEGVNVFIDEAGKPRDPMYVPAYIRRYPYMLARLDPAAEELTLCYDPESDLINEKEGEPLFDGDQPSQTLSAVLKFCEDFEVAGQRTQAFIKELEAMDMLIDGEVSIQPEGSTQPFLYRGFKMVDENKLREMDAETLHKINQNGILPLIIAHLFSLSLMREVFARQVQQGKMPEMEPAMAPAEGNA
ncbi:MAG TPA: SapC family protein [Allosphingosinicella sp.]|nr:SapC family protein [Allosphingosinicella sp.]